MLHLSVIIPCYNAARYIADTLDSLLNQHLPPDCRLELIVVDGASTDGTLDIVERYRDRLARVLSEPDSGPASAINKGFQLATGDVLGWLNADDLSCAGSLERVAAFFTEHPDTVLAFGRCRIVDENQQEIRAGITRFKQAFFPFSCRFLLQCINYVSQPACFYRAEAAKAALPLREDLKAAFDYEYHLRLLHHGRARAIPGAALSCFRWHPGSISGSFFKQQFKEEWEIARDDAGRFSLQNLLHWFVRWGIVGIYSLMTRKQTT